jgi:hypothetical protein
LTAAFGRRKADTSRDRSPPGSNGTGGRGGNGNPETILGWYRKLIANKFDGSRFRRRVVRPRIDEDAKRLAVQMAKENSSWGYDRIVGALANLDFLLSDRTVNILCRDGLSPAPKREQTISWTDFIRSHMEVVGAIVLADEQHYRNGEEIASTALCGRSVLWLRQTKNLYGDAAGTRVADRYRQAGGTVARNGLRMMPTFPPSP